MGPSQVYSYGAVKGCRVCFPGPVRLLSSNARIRPPARLDGSPLISMNSSTMSLGDMRLGRHSTYTAIVGLGVSDVRYIPAAPGVAARLAPEYNSLNS